MNELSKAAAILGKKGGLAGRGASKSRRSDLARAAAIRRWGTVEERFWKKISKGGPAECWSWTGTRNRKGGYGRFYFPGHVAVPSHRIAWELSFGPIPEEMNVLHKCDNPACCNPNHLFLGTQMDNTNDSIAKGRYCRLKGSKNGNAKLNETDVIEVRRLRSSGLSMRTLAKRFNVDRRAIQLLLSGKTWTHV